MAALGLKDCTRAVKTGRGTYQMIIKAHDTGYALLVILPPSSVKKRDLSNI
jgi:hypothetical protein